jgi:hypothetical protein
MLDGVFSVLQWQGDRYKALDHAESAYTSLITGILGRELSLLKKARPVVAARILGLLTSADNLTLRRVVLAPETSCRLLWGHPGGCDDRDFWRFLTDSLDLEFSRLSHSPVGALIEASSEALPRARWSALGDFRVGDARVAVVSQPSLTGLTVDADSPASICFDSSVHDVGMQLLHYGDHEAKETALRKVEAAMLALDAMDPAIAGFVRRFTLVANIVTDGERSGFSSGSTDQYVGRSIFWNADLPSVDTEMLAEALVHEAIHSLLYMHEVREPWFLSQELLSSDAVVESPWTGSMLRVEPFLQACFVWFGLCHFWSLARRESPFKGQRAEASLATARQGFLEGPLLSRVSGYLSHITPQVLDLVRAMQEDVVSGARGRAAAPLRSLPLSAAR